MTKRGRKPLLDEAKLREICALASLGCRMRMAARYVGCSLRTLEREFERNEEFRERLIKAQVGAQATPLDAMRKAAATHWRAAAWLLERGFPTDFARRSGNVVPVSEVKHAISELIYAVKAAFLDETVQKRIGKSLERTFEDQVKRIRSPRRPASRRFDPPVRLEGLDKYRADAIHCCHDAEIWMGQQASGENPCGDATGSSKSVAVATEHLRAWQKASGCPDALGSPLAAQFTGDMGVGDSHHREDAVSRALSGTQPSDTHTPDTKTPDPHIPAGGQ